MNKQVNLPCKKYKKTILSLIAKTIFFVDKGKIIFTFQINLELQCFTLLKTTLHFSIFYYYY